MSNCFIHRFGLAALCMAMAFDVAAGGRLDKASCTFNGKKMYGKIQVVDSFPDVKIQEVASFPDIKVQKVSAFPDSCGKWQIVTSFPDTKVQFVSSFPDVKIQYVTSFPGTN